MKNYLEIIPVTLLIWSPGDVIITLQHLTVMSPHNDDDITVGGRDCCAYFVDCV